MLIENKDHYIHVFKTITGEEIIARVVSSDDKSYSVEKPLQMIIGPQGAQFAPFMFMARSDKSLQIYKSGIVASSAPSLELESQYLSAITGIALTQKSSIITN